MKTFVQKYLRPAIVLTVLLTILTGFIYPGIITGIAQLIFPYQANGSLVKDSHGNVIGSELIGQYWTSPQYFHGRPSAAVDQVPPPNGGTPTPVPYSADNSNASNAGPTNASYIQTVQQRVADLQKDNPDASGPVPVDLVNASASGLDPNITIAGALYQAPRIAKVRNLSLSRVQQLINDNTQGRFLGIFGEPRVNVFDLNLALDALKK
jgi:potassium-transporting ATPase KdpC subunit